jgi:hypothetical protein
MFAGPKAEKRRGIILMRRGQGRVRGELKAVGRRGRGWKRSPEPRRHVSDPCTAYTSHPEP